jgi:hypothetical protein
LGANATQIFSDLGATELPNSASAGMPGLFLPAALLENARDCSQRKTNNALNKSSFAWHRTMREQIERAASTQGAQSCQHDAAQS